MIADDSAILSPHDHLNFIKKVREQLRFHGIEVFKFLGSDARSHLIHSKQVSSLSSISMVKFFGKFDQLLIYASFVQKIFIVIQSKFNQFGESLLLQNKRKGH